MSFLSETVQQVLTDMGGRADVTAIAVEARAKIGPDRYQELTWAGFIGEVRKALRDSAEGELPAAMSIGKVYVQRVLFTVDDYRVGIQSYVRQSHQSVAKAEALAAECFQKYGVTIPIEGEATG